MPSTTQYAVFISVDASKDNDTYVYLKAYDGLPPDVDRFGSNELYKSVYISEDRHDAFHEYLSICPFDEERGRLVNKVPTRLVAAIETLRTLNSNVDFMFLSGNGHFPQNKEAAENAYMNNHGML